MWKNDCNKKYLYPLAELNIDFFERFCLKNDSYKKKKPNFAVGLRCCYNLMLHLNSICIYRVSDSKHLNRFIGTIKIKINEVVWLIQKE